MYTTAEEIRTRLLESCLDVRDFLHSIPPHGMVFLTLQRDGNGMLDLSLVRHGLHPEGQLRRAVREIDGAE